MTVADAIARWLHEKGITHAFGIIGGGNVALWNSIAALEKTSIVAVHHEQAAAMAATYYWRTCGRPALCLVTTGAGSTNAITGVMAAHFDSVPLIVISGNEPQRYLDDVDNKLPGNDERVRGTQGFESQWAMRAFVKETYSLRHWPTMSAVWVRSLLDNALATSLEDRSGPVWIDIAKDVQTCALSS